MTAAIATLLLAFFTFITILVSLKTLIHYRREARLRRVPHFDLSVTRFQPGTFEVKINIKIKNIGFGPGFNIKVTPKQASVNLKLLPSKAYSLAVNGEPLELELVLPSAFYPDGVDLTKEIEIEIRGSSVDMLKVIQIFGFQVTNPPGNITPTNPVLKKTRISK